MAVYVCATCGALSAGSVGTPQCVGCGSFKVSRVEILTPAAAKDVTDPAGEAKILVEPQDITAPWDMLFGYPKDETK